MSLFSELLLEDYPGLYLCNTASDSWQSENQLLLGNETTTKQKVAVVISMEETASSLCLASVLLCLPADLQVLLNLSN